MDLIKITRSKCEWRVGIGQQYCPESLVMPDAATLTFRRMGQSHDCAQYCPASIKGNILNFVFGDLLFNNPGRYMARLEIDCCPCGEFEFQVGDNCVTTSQEVVAQHYKKGSFRPSDFNCQPQCRQCLSDPCACKSGPDNCREFCRVTGIGSIRSVDNACPC